VHALCKRCMGWCNPSAIATALAVMQAFLTPKPPAITTKQHLLRLYITVVAFWLAANAAWDGATWPDCSNRRHAIGWTFPTTVGQELVLYDLSHWLRGGAAQLMSPYGPPCPKRGVDSLIRHQADFIRSLTRLGGGRFRGEGERVLQHSLSAASTSD
jgi:hypothetical protein